MLREPSMDAPVTFAHPFHCPDASVRRGGPRHASFLHELIKASQVHKSQLIKLVTYNAATKDQIYKESKESWKQCLFVLHNVITQHLSLQL